MSGSRGAVRVQTRPEPVGVPNRNGATARPMTSADELRWLDATAQADLVRAGEAKPTELVDAAIERIEDANDRLNAVIHLLFDEARAVAQSGDLADDSHS